MYCVKSTPSSNTFSPKGERVEKNGKEGIIEKVEGPTDWFVGILPVLKLNNTVRICVYLTKLIKEYNKNAILCQVLNNREQV